MPTRMRSLQARCLPHGYLDLFRQVALFAIGYYAYRLVRGFVDDPASAAVAFENGRDLISLERALHVFVEPSIQAWADAQPLIVDAASREALVLDPHLDQVAEAAARLSQEGLELKYVVDTHTHADHIATRERG